MILLVFLGLFCFSKSGVMTSLFIVSVQDTIISKNLKRITLAHKNLHQNPSPQKMQLF